MIFQVLDLEQMSYTLDIPTVVLGDLVLYIKVVPRFHPMICEVYNDGLRQRVQLVQGKQSITCSM